MSRGADFAEYIVHDILRGIPGITSRRMFGGYGIYKDGVFFALIADDELYFKVDETNRVWYEQRGSKPFTYSRAKKKAVTLSYWLLPDDVMEDRQELRRLVDASVEVGKRAKRNVGKANKS